MEVWIYTKRAKDKNIEAVCMNETVLYVYLWRFYTLIWRGERGGGGSGEGAGDSARFSLSCIWQFLVGVWANCNGQLY